MKLNTYLMELSVPLLVTPSLPRPEVAAPPPLAALPLCPRPMWHRTFLLAVVKKLRSFL